MAIKKGNIQVYTTLQEEIVNLIDCDAKKEMRTRSKQIAKIIIEHYQKQGGNHQ